tara:strand:- start:170 stop:844 length:675 start_codon:yes stop_codon:yes gene_type:complete
MSKLNIYNQLFTRWLFFISSLIVFIYILIFYGFIAEIINNDFTFISILIMIIFIVFTIHIGMQIKKVDSILLLFYNQNSKDDLEKLLILLNKNCSNNYYAYSVHTYFKSMFDPISDNDNLEMKITKYSDTAWYVVDLLIKLGLVGTVIGFIIMLSSIVTIENFDLSLMQTLLQKMSAGMMIALYTTLTGLVSSILLAFQNKILEGGIYDIYAYSREIKSRINTK